jgi:hypothetical protein
MVEVTTGAKQWTYSSMSNASNYSSRNLLIVIPAGVQIRREGADEAAKIDQEGCRRGGTRRGGLRPTRRFYPTRSSTDKEDARSRELIELVDIEAGINICITSALLFHNGLCYLHCLIVV